MDKKFIILAIILSIVAIYLQRGYARIYDRNESVLPLLSWNKPILFKNSNFQNSIKYVSLGDSLTVGVGSNNITQTYPYIFAQSLSKFMSVSLVNLAIRGATSSDVINSQLEKAVAENPNYVSLFIGVNDVYGFKSNKEFEENFDRITTVLINNTQAKIIILNIPYLGSDSLIVFPYNNIFNYRVQQFNKIISKTSSEKNIILIDLYTPTKEIFSKQSNFYSSDNFHPSADGYLLWETLLSNIK